MISKAALRYIRISPRKVRPVIALVKGKPAEDAVSILHSVKRKAAVLLLDVINSAIANAKRVPGTEISSLYISSLVANGGPQLKRFRAASMGRASNIRKRTSHITVELSANIEKKPQDPAAAAASENAKKKNIKVTTKVSSKEGRAIRKPKAKEQTKADHGKKGEE